ncbi:MAG: F0F1 ATP synthase subunit epsilon [Cyclobacteriaceae bacterium]
MYLEIVTPDKTHFQGEVDQATFPGSDGSFQILNLHAPMISTLGKGELRFIKKKDHKDNEIIWSVEGGVVEVLNNRITVLAEAVEQ